MTEQERKAMQMALEALQVMKAGQHAEEKAYMDKVIEALHQALAHPEQEPVAYMTYKGYLYHASDPKVLEHSDPTPLYAAPPSKPWVSLTDEEIGEAIKSCKTTDTYKYFRAIEAKLKEKNNG